jgi:predicted transposase YbfD/YdcC
MGTSIAEHFAKLPDPRIERHKKYPLEEIICLVICAVVGGADGWEAIEEFGRTKKAWLQQYLPLKNGIPAHDTIARVMSRISAKGLQECFMNWVSSVNEVTAGELIAIDGKTVRRSHDRRHRKSAIHMVSAWASTQGVVLGQCKTEEKSNEITAIPALLNLLAIKGCVVSIDAMGCQKEIAKQIVAQEADYELAVKGNQGQLEEAVISAFSEVTPKACAGFDYHEEMDKGHGRVEVRRYWTCPVDEHFALRSLWAGLSSLGMTESERHLGDKVSIERRYYIRSRPSDAEAFAKAIRAHWEIENKLHWTLDVTFREDECRIRRGEAAENFCTLRHFVLNLFKQETSTKKSIKRKRQIAAWDDDYRAKVLFGT